MCTSVLLAYVCVLCVCLVLMEARKDFGSGTGGTYSCEPPCVGAGNGI